MIIEKINQTKQMSEQTGKHWQWCAHKVANAMTDAEIMAFATEEGSRGFTGTAIRATTGIHNRTGQPLSKTEQSEQRNDIVVMIAGYIIGKLTEERAAANR